MPKPGLSQRELLKSLKTRAILAMAANGLAKLFAAVCFSPPLIMSRCRSNLEDLLTN